jgi:GNAT superfamily N-acetyltransferase
MSGQPVHPQSVAPVAFRCEVLPSDQDLVREIVASTGVFRLAEIEVAVELVAERLAKGPASGYHFLFAECDGQTRGYACYGPIAGTLHSYDLYWIVVHRSAQGRSLGRLLLEEAERQVREAGGQRIYVETSGRDQYAPTRAFYEHFGYRREAVLPDFYAPGDDKIVYLKVL